MNKVALNALLGAISVAAATGASATISSAHAAEAAASDNNEFGTIVVTAQRREERLKDVPLAISVVSAASLEKSNLTTIADIQFLSPGVNYNSNFGGGFNLRGVGTQSLLMTAEQSVGLVIDDVTQGLPEVSFAGPSYQSMSDIERIEVLKGPQGTLFGKNSSAGVIQIITKSPVIGQNSVDGSVSYGSKNEAAVMANANFAVSDNAALRVSGSAKRRDGFIRNAFTNKNIWGYKRYDVRAKFLVRPSDNFSILLSGEYRHLNDDANGQWTVRSCGSGSGAFFPCVELAKYGVVASPTNMAGAWEGRNFTRQDSHTFSAKIQYDFDAATFTSITAYRHLRQPIGVDTDNTPRPIYSYNRNTSGGSQFTQELRLNGHSGILDYTAGAFYYNAKPYQLGMNAGTLGLLPDTSGILLSTTAIGPSSGFGYPVRVDAKTESYAAFGQLEAKILPQFTLIAGGRYTNDKVTQRINYFELPFICRTAFFSGGTCHPSNVLPAESLASTKADKFTYKFTAKYDVTDDVNVYVSYATGYKGPMISYPANQPQQLLRPETSKSWEIGLKSQLFDDQLIFNIDGFKVDYKDFQGQQRIGQAPIFFYTTTNAGGLQTKGVETDAAWRVSQNVTLSANVSYVEAKYTEFSVQCFDLYTNPATPVGQCNYLQPGVPAGTAFQFNAAGYPLIYSPKWTYNLTADFNLPVSDGMSFNAHANYSYRSKTYGVVADPNSINPGYGIFNGEISYGHEDGQWRVALWARNLFDKYYVAGIFRTPLDAGTYGSTPRSTLGYSNIPALDSRRSFGVKVLFNFGT